MISFGDAYLELLLNRIKLLFSVETVCFVGLFMASHKIAERLGLRPAIGLRWANPDLYRLYQIGFFGFIILLGLLVYGTGEFVRRKYKLNSLFFYNTKDVEKQQKIIELMHARQDITIEQISFSLEITPVHVGAYIRVLKKMGTVEQKGTRKKPHWAVRQ